MSLEGVYFVSLSIGAIIVSLSLAIFILYFIKLMRALRLINEKVLLAAQESVEVAEETKEYIGKIGKSVVDYFIFKLIKSARGKK